MFFFTLFFLLFFLFAYDSNQIELPGVPAGSPLRGGDVTVYVPDIKQPSFPTPFSSVLVSVSDFMAISTAFHSINSPDNSFLTLFFWSYFCLIGPFNRISLYESLPQP